MLVATLVLVAALVQQPAGDAPPDLAVIDARLGDCSADFTVSAADATPIYAATIHVRIRYGFMGIKRMDLEVGTNSDGKARVAGLPEKSRPLLYDVWKDDLKTTVQQDVERTCAATFDVSLK
jgi:hypothetical protein